MALATAPVTGLLTYEQYLAEPEDDEIRRYEILDGERIYMSNPTRQHQLILIALLMFLRSYARQSQSGTVYVAPCDILIKRKPLRTRQPDLIFISAERLAQNPPATDPAPLSPAPELVVEILSPSENRRIRAAKLSDYLAVGVRELWLVSPEAETIEIVRLLEGMAETVAIYASSHTLQSALYPDLTFSVAEVFAI